VWERKICTLLIAFEEQTAVGDEKTTDKNVGKEDCNKSNKTKSEI